MPVTYHNLYFTTATILEWKHLLTDELKDIIIGSFQYLTENERAKIYSFVIMPNHIHVIWLPLKPHELMDVKSALLSFTAHRFKLLLKLKDTDTLKNHRVNAADRAYQFWERNALSIPIFSKEVFHQKQNYIHKNPCADKWNLSKSSEDYKYSSAYMENGKPFWSFLSSID